MPPDSLLRRVRWGNVARLLALPAVVALVALWPRLSPPPPRVPGAAPAPVARAPQPAPARARPRTTGATRLGEAKRSRSAKRPRLAKGPRTAKRRHVAK